PVQGDLNEPDLFRQLFDKSCYRGAASKALDGNDKRVIMLFLGIDIGSSSVKLSVIDGQSGKNLGSVTHPEAELGIQSPQAGWAEQDPEIWWDCIKQGCARLFAKGSFDP